MRAPPVARPHAVHIEFSEEEACALAELACRKRRSKAEVLRHALEFYRQIDGLLSQGYRWVPSETDRKWIP